MSIGAVFTGGGGGVFATRDRAGVIGVGFGTTEPEVIRLLVGLQKQT